ncbi:Uncharacterized protein DBV15_07259 [Temnothorax longispinosus]|uniref:Uncharacterized protein n=1 Tax=Temnothorax longispinosus TaxID=300112 RepID=A0A4S2JNF9_9HYME|nr:Uncharacterized protein DBV15_07259 [Temnothorax longispinosus]
MGDSWANGLPLKYSVPGAKAAALGCVIAAVLATSFDAKRVGSLAEAYNNPLVRWTKLRGAFGVYIREGRERERGGKDRRRVIRE